FVVYALVLLILSVRYARVSAGMTLALFLMIAVRSVSEVPLTLFGYGDDLIAQLLLLMTLAGAASEMRIRKVEVATARQRRATLQSASDSLASAGFNS
ncbi:MAG: O-antigen ligase family protein, partial [Rhodoferax sp.]